MITRSAFITFSSGSRERWPSSVTSVPGASSVVGEPGAVVALGLADLGDPEAVRGLDVELAVRVAEPGAADHAGRA